MIKPNQRLTYVAFGLAGLFAAALGFVNALWLRKGSLTTAELAIDAVSVIVGSALAIYFGLYARRHPEMLPDEYAEARKKYAAQMGVICGLILLVMAIFAKNFFPDSFATLIDGFSGKDEAYAAGLNLGAFSMLIGLVLGWVMAFVKYR